MKLSTAFKILWTLVLIFLMSSNLKSAHIVGGEITYRCLDSNRYEITLTLFRDCNGTGFRTTARIGYFKGVTGSLFTQKDVPRDTVSFVPLNAVSSCLIVPSGTCLEQAIFIDTVALPPDSNGYDISYSICCRTNASSNIIIPVGFFGGAGSTYHTHIPPNDTLCNSSPTFNSFPPVVLCINDPINIDYSATDLDGDSLVYEFVTPYAGGSSRNPNPNPTPPPYGIVNWDAGFSVTNQVTASTAFSLDSATGILTGTPSSLGSYVTGVTVKEYRNGVLINETRRDFLMIIVNCLPTSTAISNPGVICNSYTVNFGNSSTGTPLTTYLWDFGDTSTLQDTSTLRSPHYTYPDTGVYTVTLISDPYSPACADTFVRQIQLYPIIAPVFIKPANQCFNGHSFDFTAIGNYFGTTQIEWDFGPSATSRFDTTLNPTGITFSTSGRKVISLRYRDYGCDTTVYDTIEVYDNPVSHFGFSSSNCVDFTIQFSDSSSFSKGYYWDFGDSSSLRDTSTSANPTYIYPDTGVYTVMLVINSDSSLCPDTSYKQITVDPILSPFFVAPSVQCLHSNSFDFNAAGAFFDSTLIDWDFGPTATSTNFTGQNPTGIVFNSSGKKPISVRYRDFGCDTTFMDTIEVYQSPIANFSFTPDNNCINHIINFTDSSLHTGNYYWDFGDTSSVRDTSTSANPTYTFPDSGVYTVMLVVDSNSSVCPDTMYQQVIITPILSPFFTAPMNQCIIGNSFDFNAGGAIFDSTLVDWNFGPSATPGTSTNRNPTGISFNSIGRKVISIRYRDFGCDTTFYDTIEVYQSPIANFSFTTDNSCINQTVHFNDSSLHTGNYYWDFGVTSSLADTSTSASPTFTYPDSGTYTVMLVVDSNSSICPDTLYQQVVIDPILSPFYTAPMDQCLRGNSFDFNASGAFYSGTQIDWDFGSSAFPSTSTNQNPTGIVFNSSGMKVISIRYRNFGCDTTFVDSIEVFETPTSNFSYTDNHCINHTIQFIDSSLFVGDYYWDFGVTTSATDTSTYSNPAFTYPDSGTYTVMLVIGSQFLACPDTSYQTIRIDPILSPSFTPPPNQCFTGNSFNFRAGGAFYNGTQIDWDFGSTATPSTSTNQNPTGVIYSTQGWKTISIRYRDFGCDTAYVDSIHVYELPVADFAIDHEICTDLIVDFYDSSLFAGNYQWDFGVIGTNVDTSSAQSPTYTYPDTGIYTVRLIVSSQYLLCAPDTLYKQVRIYPVLEPRFNLPDNQCFVGNVFTFNGYGIYYPTTQINWNFGTSGTPSVYPDSLNPPSVTFNTSGKKPISLIFTDFACVITYTDTVEVYDNPVSNFSFTDNNCHDLTVQFHDSTQFTTSYYWDFGVLGSTTDTSTLANPTFTYPDSGVYTIRLIADANTGLCPDTSYRQISLSPILNPFYSKPVNQCLTGNSFDFVAAGVSFPGTLIDWDFGPSAVPSTSSNPNPTGVVFSTSGRKAVTIRYRDFGCDTTFTDTIEVYDNPLSYFSYSNDNCLSMNVQFHDSTQFATSYSWDFGVTTTNTDTSSLANPSFTYPDSGTYTIRLIVDGNTSLCPDTSYQTIRINPILSPYFLAPGDQCLSRNSFNFNAGGAFFSATQIDWDFGPSATPSTFSGQNPTGIVYSSIGRKAVSVRYRDFGCDTTFIDTIEVYSSPFADFSFTDNNCVDFNIQFTDSSSFADFYYWDFGVAGSTTDTSTSVNPSFTFPDSGTFTVMLIAGSNSSICPDTSFQQVRIHPLLNPYFAKPINQCFNGNSFDFNAGGAFFNTTQIDWDFGPSATPSTSVNQNPTGISFNTIGKKAITVRYRAFGCDTTFTDTIEIYNSPFSNFSFTENNCVDFNVQFYDSTLFADFYYWDFGVAASTTDTSTLANPSFTFPDSGTYTVMLVAGTNSSICPDTSYQTVTMHPLLSPYFAPPANQCIGGNSFDFNAGGNFYGTTQIDWDFGPSATPSTGSGSNPTGIVFNSIGKKAITIRYRAFGCDTSYTDTIEVYQTPFSNFSFSPNNCWDFSIDFTELSMHAGTYYWDFGDTTSVTDTSTSPNPTFIFPDSGVYTVMLVIDTFPFFCPDTMYQTVTMHPLLSPYFAAPGPQCLNGNSFDFNAGGAYYGSTQIDWDFGPSATPSTSTSRNPAGIVYNTFGQKLITIRYRAFGCDTSYTDTIEVYPSPAADFVIIEDEYCIGDSLIVDLASLSDPKYIHYWDFEDTTFTNVFAPVYVYKDTGLYTITQVVENSYGCTDTMIQTNGITIHPSPTALFTPIDLRTSYYFPYVTFQNTSLNYNFSTFDDGAGTIASPFSQLNTDYQIEGYYYPLLIVENNVGCFDTISGRIFYEMKYNMFVPNAFTPNDDGVNDVFLPVTNIDSNYTMTIYNKWGEEIFVTTDVTKGWDGTSNGVALPVDSYVYRIVYRDPKLKNQELIGHVNLIR